MERLDKVIASITSYSRRDVKRLVQKGSILVNEKNASSSDMKVDIDNDVIELDGNVLNTSKYVYLVLNKPSGYVSATKDELDKTVLDLVPPQYKSRNLFPVGRLDKDTTGMLLITDDGEFAHNLLAPSKHIDKVYEVTIDKEMTEEMVKGFKEGIPLKDGICKSSKLEIIDKNKGLVTLTEGRYHQVKRMFLYYKATVTSLNRIKMGNLYLPSDLKEGEIRELSKEELMLIK